MDDEHDHLQSLDEQPGRIGIRYLDRSEHGLYLPAIWAHYTQMGGSTPREEWFQTFFEVSDVYLIVDESGTAHGTYLFEVSISGDFVSPHIVFWSLSENDRIRTAYTAVLMEYRLRPSCRRMEARTAIGSYASSFAEMIGFQLMGKIPGSDDELWVLPREITDG